MSRSFFFCLMVAAFLSCAGFAQTFDRVTGDIPGMDLARGFESPSGSLSVAAQCVNQACLDAR